MRGVEARHFATRCGAVAGIGNGDGADWRRLKRGGLERAGGVVEWLGKGLNERGHDRGCSDKNNNN